MCDEKYKDIKIKRIKTLSEVNDCIEIQRKTWGMEDIDVIPSHLIRAYSDDNFGGIILGAYEKSNMVGFLL